MSDSLDNWILGAFAHEDTGRHSRNRLTPPAYLRVILLTHPDRLTSAFCAHQR